MSASSLDHHPRSRWSVGLEDLFIEQNLQALDSSSNSFQATGHHASFIIQGPFRPGWWRLHLRIERLDELKQEREQAELRADYGNGFDDGPPLERIIWNESLDEPEIWFRLARPAQSLRFQPLSGLGAFVLHTFEGKRLSRLGAFFSALRRKIRLLRDYNCTGRVLKRGLLLLLSGRLGEFRRKLFKGLPDTRRYKPENEAYLRSLAGLGRWRAQLSSPERDRYEDEYEHLPEKPLIAVLFPVVNLPNHSLFRGVESVLQQVWKNRELHIVLPGDAPAEQVKLADSYAERDEQIRVSLAAEGGSVDDAFRDALDKSEAEFLVVLQPGYELEETALLKLMQAKIEAGDGDFIIN